ncbi:MAG: hypothetical protein WKF76_00825 [Nocardioidaceae bacterium]
MLSKLGLLANRLVMIGASARAPSRNGKDKNTSIDERDDLVERAAGEPGDQADGHADDGGEERREQRDGERGADAVEEPGQVVVGRGGVEAERMLPGERAERRAVLGPGIAELEVLRGRSARRLVVEQAERVGDERGEDSRQHEDEDDRGRHDRDLVLAESIERDPGRRPASDLLAGGVDGRSYLGVAGTKNLETRNGHGCLSSTGRLVV